jgi:prolyl oligopeptidase PreP (S9A serine peptidase family)
VRYILLYKMLPIEFVNVLPEEIINIICEYADTGTRIIYDAKRKIHVYRFIEKHDRFQNILSLYDSCTFETRRDDFDEPTTQISYEIKLKKVPSWIEKMNIEQNFKSYMILTVSEDGKDYHTCTVMDINRGTLMLN